MNDIVKVCKKHGELKIDQTYLMKTQASKLIRMCSICKRGYRNDWAKLNPEKVKIAQNKMKTKRLAELKNGSLKKICHRHGDLPISKIRVDARGTRICRLCSNEDKIKSRKNVDPTGEKYRKWLYSDRERLNRYRKNDYPKRKIRQIKAYYRLKENDPNKFKQKERQKLDAAIKSRAKLSDHYIRKIIKTIRYGGRKNRFYHYLSGAEIPKELIEIVRTHIFFKRKLKEKKHVKNSKHANA